MNLKYVTLFALTFMLHNLDMCFHLSWKLK